METPSHILFVIQPLNLFGLIYATTLVIGVVVFAFSGVRQKYPVCSWTALSASVLVLFVIGIKIFVYTPDEWGRILMGTHHDIAYIKYVPGGILLVATGVLLLKPFLGFRASVFDGFVLFLPLLGAFQRVGCFLNGCCHGTQTDLPWAVQYGWPSGLFYEHYQQGILPLGQMHSMGVHPTQLYTIILSLGVMLVLWYTRKSFKAAGSRTLFALILLGCMRFFLEFFRAPRPGTWSHVNWLSLSMLQWIIIILAVGFAFVLWKRERTRVHMVTLPPVPQDQPLRGAGVVFFLIFLVWQVREILDGIEMLVIYPVLFTSLVFFAVRLLHEITTPVSRTVLASMMAVAFLSMAQTITDAGQDDLPGQNHGWFSIGAEGGLGAYEQLHKNCDGKVVGRSRREIDVWGASAAYHYMSRPDRHFQAGLKHYYLTDMINKEYYYSYRYSFWMPYVRYDGSSIGLGGGFVFGIEQPMEDIPEYGPMKKYIPGLYFRYGSREEFFYEFDFGNPHSLAGEVGYLQTGAGMGIPGMHNSVIRAGLAFDNQPRTGLYLGADMLLANRLRLTPNFTLMRYPTFSLGLHYHFGQNRWKPDPEAMPSDSNH